MALRQAERGRGVGHVPHFGAHPRRLGVPEGVLKGRQLTVDRGVSRLVRAGEVRPDAGDPKQPVPLGLDRLVHHERPVVRLQAVAAEPGVRLELDPRGPAGPLDGVEDRVQRPLAGDGDVDVGAHQRLEVVAGGVQPGQDRRLDPGRAQRERLLGHRGADPGGSGLEGGAGAGDHAVSVGVGLHHGHDLRRGRDLAQPPDVRPKRVEVDPGFESGGRQRGVVTHPRIFCQANGKVATRSPAATGPLRAASSPVAPCR